MNGVQGVGSSNLLAPTNKINGLRFYREPFFMPFFIGVHNGVQAHNRYRGGGSKFISYFYIIAIGYNKQELKIPP